MNCDRCHGDKETNWYKTWLGSETSATTEDTQPIGNE